MTKEWYKQKGYHIGLEGAQEVIDRAEREVKVAYIDPILPNADFEHDDDVKQCLADLAYMRMLQITLFVTRSGSKEKYGSNSSNPSSDAKFYEQGRVAAGAVDKLREMSGANAVAKVDDICQLFFKSNYFYQ
jgi:hypothetical protein